MTPLKTVIMAGGKGTRIADFYTDIPKPMIPVFNKPILQYQIECLSSQGYCDIALIVGHMVDRIIDYFGDGERFGVNISYIIEKEPLGTGGALSLLPREDILLLMGDILLNVDFQRFQKFHYTKKGSVTLFVHPNSHPWDSDTLAVNTDSCVTDWISKKDEKREEQRNLVNAGIYILSKDILPTETVKTDLDKEIIFPHIKRDSVFAYRSTEYVKDMGTPDRIKQVLYDLKNGIICEKGLTHKQRAVFLDRDGVINIYKGFITDPNQIELIDESAEAIHLLNASKFLVICVTNQPVIARGEVSFSGLEKIHARLDFLLAKEAGAYLDDLLYCPHHPHAGYEKEIPELKIECDCRKPKPGMLYSAAERYNIDLNTSYIVGDSKSDIQAGKSAGCTTLGVLTGVGLKDLSEEVFPDKFFTSLYEVVEYILSKEKA